MEQPTAGDGARQPPSVVVTWLHKSFLDDEDIHVLSKGCGGEE